MASLSKSRGVRLAIEGCGHGTLNAIYSAVQQSCATKGWDGVDLVIIGGDFQSVRNARDLSCMSVPAKYREIGDFHEYYSGVRRAPYLTIFIGGNHEASNYLWELYHGGWVAPNIYYLGAANVVRLGPLRIAGLSGIWKGYNYQKPHYERLPYNQDDVKSIYHVREVDVRKLLLLRTQVDIGLSHDWPRAVEWSGNHQALFRKKNLFEVDSRAGNLGSVAAKYVLDRLRPAYWFSAHLHVKFPAIVKHENSSEGPANDPATPKEAPAISGPLKNDAEIDLDLEDDADVGVAESAVETSEGKSPSEPFILDGPTSFTTHSTMVGSPMEALRARLPASFSRPVTTRKPDFPPPSAITNQVTQFLALDKCLPRREFLQLLEVSPVSHQAEDWASNSSRPLRLAYDAEWLAITRAMAGELRLGDRTVKTPPDLGEAHYRPLIEKEEAWVEEHIVKRNKLEIPENFTITAPTHDAGDDIHRPTMPIEYNNPQTAEYCRLLDIENAFFATDEEKAERLRTGPAPAQARLGGDSYRGGRGRGRGRGFHRGGRRGRGNRGRG